MKQNKTIETAWSSLILHWSVRPHPRWTVAMHDASRIQDELFPGTPQAAGPSSTSPSTLPQGRPTSHPKCLLWPHGSEVRLSAAGQAWDLRDKVGRGGIQRKSGERQGTGWGYLSSASGPRLSLLIPLTLRLPRRTQPTTAPLPSFTSAPQSWRPWPPSRCKTASPTGTITKTSLPW